MLGLGAPGPSDDSTVERKVRVHKMRPVSAALDGTGPSTSHPTSSQLAAALDERNARMDRAIAEIIPSLADVSLNDAGKDSAESAAAELRRLRQAKEERALADAKELATIFDMSVPHPLDTAPPAEPWQNKARPTPKKIVLSPYQYEMINYQRMLMRKNIWYYRDRMNVPRGPCPLHTLKDCWVQGIIDENTLVWGHGLYDWLPAKNVKLLIPMIRTPEVQLGAWIKKTFSLKPTLNRIREQRKEYRDPALRSDQVDRMR